MTANRLDEIRIEIGRRVDDIRAAGNRLSPLDLHGKMEEIRLLAAGNGIDALECLARTTAQLALLPGHRLAVQSAFEHVEEAFACRTPQDTTAMLAALALRLH